MSFEGVMLLGGSLLLSIALAYACWVNVRVICLQERLFVIRDALFDEAHMMGCLGDAAYQYYREAINSTIRLAPTFSMPTLVQMILRRSTIEHEEAPPKSDNSAFQESIDRAILSAEWEVLNYVVRHTITGRISLMTQKVVHDFSDTFSGFITTQATDIYRRMLPLG